MAFGKILRPVFDPGLAVAPWWKVAGKTCVAAYQPKGAASLAASYVNLANPGTYDAAPGVAPTWAAETGWGFLAPGKYLDTGVVPASGWSMFVRFSSSMLFGDVYLCGMGIDAQNVFYLTHNFVATGVNYGNGTVLGAIAPPLANGVIGVAGVKAYRNGVAEPGSMSGTILTAVSIYIGLFNYNGTTYGSNPSANILALSIYSGTLTDGESATLSAAMAAL